LKNDRNDIAILGAGIAGFGAADRFFSEGIKSTMYERRSYYGGHTASFKFKEGFIFDDGPHISFTQNERIQKIFAGNVDNKYEKIQSRVNNYWKGNWVKHPAQCNLYGLPEDLVTSIILEFIETKNKNGETEINNYQDWLEASFGKTFAKNFPMQYGKKFHTTTADNMNTDWLGPRLYKPNIEEVIRGAISPVTPEVHYIDHFRYPTDGGFMAYLKPYPEQTNLKLNHNITGIDLSEKIIEFENGSSAAFNHIVSSLPLNVIIPLIKNVPNDVLEASNKLACTKCVIVNVGIDRSDISDCHWTYFYDDDFIFSRISFPHMFSPNTVPPGHGSIQAEIYFSDKYKPMNISLDECLEKTIDDLRRCGLIKEDDKIVIKKAWVTPFAQVIFDLERNENLKIVHGYLDDQKIEYCGRYGKWEYIWTDDSFISGEQAAQNIINRMIT
jgi:protoporphyrinogen oxidase